MQFETSRLRLRELTMDDINDLHKILSDPESMLHYPALYDLDKSKKWIEWNIENYANMGLVSRQ